MRTRHVVHLPRSAESDAEFAAVSPGSPQAAANEPFDGGERVVVRDGGEGPVARCALYSVTDLHGAPGLSGLIGRYECSDREAGIELLRHACTTLVDRGAKRVIGPMDGSTWARYRLVLPPDSAEAGANGPPFLGEPWNPPDYPDHFAAAGFNECGRYESRLLQIAGGEPSRDFEGSAGTPPEGITGRRIAIRALELARLDDELRSVFEFCLAAFADNPYYAPTTYEAFRATLGGVQAILDPDLVLLAHNPARKLVGLVLTYPDVLALESGRPTRVVVKTLATGPDARGIGLSAHLLELVSLRARAKGYRALIHALMHVSNISMNMSVRRDTTLYRRYALYEWKP